MQNSDRTNITGYDAPLAPEVDQARRIAEMIKAQNEESVNIAKLVTSAATIFMLGLGVAMTYGLFKLIDWVMP